jgi:hypothetical protein
VRLFIQPARRLLKGNTMFRTIAALLAAAAAIAAGSPSGTDRAVVAPSTYEVQINGENFLVDGNRQVKLESKTKPGVSYTVAIRVSPTQRVRLGAIQFDYDLPGKVEADRRGENRSARLTHELGFSVLFCDLARSLDPKAQEKALEILAKSVVTPLRDAKVQGLEVGEPHQHTFEGSAARGETIRFRDAKGLEHVNLVYVFAGRTYSATCVVEYLESDSDEVLPLIKRVLDSVRAADRG